MFKDAAEVGRSYETIGTVYAEGSSGWSKNEGDLVDKIRGRAAKLGANAIILHAFNKDESGSGKWSAALLGTNDQKLQADAIRWAPAPAATLPSSGGRGANEKPMTNEDVLKLVAGGVGEYIILAKIKAGPTAFVLDTDHILELKRAGVPEHVLAAMLPGNN